MANRDLRFAPFDELSLLASMTTGFHGTAGGTNLEEPNGQEVRPSSHPGYQTGSHREFRTVSREPKSRRNSKQKPYRTTARKGEGIDLPRTPELTMDSARRPLLHPSIPEDHSFHEERGEGKTEWEGCPCAGERGGECGGVQPPFFLPLSMVFGGRKLFPSAFTRMRCVGRAQRESSASDFDASPKNALGGSRDTSGSRLWTDGSSEKWKVCRNADWSTEASTSSVTSLRPPSHSSLPSEEGGGLSTLEGDTVDEGQNSEGRSSSRDTVSAATASAVTVTSTVTDETGDEVTVTDEVAVAGDDNVQFTEVNESLTNPETPHDHHDPAHPSQYDHHGDGVYESTRPVADPYESNSRVLRAPSNGVASQLVDGGDLEEDSYANSFPPPLYSPVHEHTPSDITSAHPTGQGSSHPLNHPTAHSLYHPSVYPDPHPSPHSSAHPEAHVETLPPPRSPHHLGAHSSHHPGPYSAPYSVPYPSTHPFAHSEVHVETHPSPRPSHHPGPHSARYSAPYSAPLPSTHPFAHSEAHVETHPSPRPSHHLGAHPDPHPSSHLGPNTFTRPSTHPSHYPAPHPSPHSSPHPGPHSDPHPFAPPTSQPLPHKAPHPYSHSPAHTEAHVETHPSPRPSHHPGPHSARYSAPPPSTNPFAHPADHPATESGAHTSLHPTAHPLPHPSAFPAPHPFAHRESNVGTRPFAHPSRRPSPHPITQPSPQPSASSSRTEYPFSHPTDFPFHPHPTPAPHPPLPPPQTRAASPFTCTNGLSGARDGAQAQWMPCVDALEYRDDDVEEDYAMPPQTQYCYTYPIPSREDVEEDVGTDEVGWEDFDVFMEPFDSLSTLFSESEEVGEFGNTPQMEANAHPRPNGRSWTQLPFPYPDRHWTCKGYSDCVADDRDVELIMPAPISKRYICTNVPPGEDASSADEGNYLENVHHGAFTPNKLSRGHSSSDQSSLLFPVTVKSSNPRMMADSDQSLAVNSNDTGFSSEQCPMETFTRNILRTNKNSCKQSLRRSDLNVQSNKSTNCNRLHRPTCPTKDTTTSPKLHIKDEGSEGNTALPNKCLMDQSQDSELKTEYSNRRPVVISQGSEGKTAFLNMHLIKRFRDNQLKTALSQMRHILQPQSTDLEAVLSNTRPVVRSQKSKAEVELLKTQCKVRREGGRAKTVLPKLRSCALCRKRSRPFTTIPLAKWGSAHRKQEVVKGVSARRDGEPAALEAQRRVEGDLWSTLAAEMSMSRDNAQLRFLLEILAATTLEIATETTNVTGMKTKPAQQSSVGNFGSAALCGRSQSAGNKAGDKEPGVTKLSSAATTDSGRTVASPARTLEKTVGASTCALEELQRRFKHLNWNHLTKQLNWKDFMKDRKSHEETESHRKEEREGDLLRRVREELRKMELKRVREDVRKRKRNLGERRGKLLSKAGSTSHGNISPSGSSWSTLHSECPNKGTSKCVCRSGKGSFPCRFSSSRSSVTRNRDSGSRSPSLKGSPVRNNSPGKKCSSKGFN